MTGVSHSRAGKARLCCQYNWYGKEAQRRQRGCAKLLCEYGERR